MYRDNISPDLPMFSFLGVFSDSTMCEYYIFVSQFLSLVFLACLFVRDLYRIIWRWLMRVDLRQVHTCSKITTKNNKNILFSWKRDWLLFIYFYFWLASLRKATFLLYLLVLGGRRKRGRMGVFFIFIIFCYCC